MPHLHLFKPYYEWVRRQAELAGMRRLPMAICQGVTPYFNSHVLSSLLLGNIPVHGDGKNHGPATSTSIKVRIPYHKLL